MKFLRNSF